MRRCRIITWIFIFSIVNFALGAPAAVREGLEMPLAGDIAEGGTVTSQKRKNSLDEPSTSNAAADQSPTDTHQTWNPTDMDGSLWGLRSHGPHSGGWVTPYTPTPASPELVGPSGPDIPFSYTPTPNVPNAPMGDWDTPTHESVGPNGPFPPYTPTPNGPNDTPMGGLDHPFPPYTPTPPTSKNLESVEPNESDSLMDGWDPFPYPYTPTPVGPNGPKDTLTGGSPLHPTTPHPEQTEVLLPSTPVSGGSPPPSPGLSEGLLLTPGWSASPMSPGLPAKRPSPSPSLESGEIRESSSSPNTQVLSANPDTLSPQSHPGSSKDLLLTPDWLLSPMSPGRPAKRPPPSPSLKSGEILDDSSESLSPSTHVLSANPDALSPQTHPGPSKGLLLTPNWSASPMSPGRPAKRPSPSSSLESGEIRESSSGGLSPSTQVLSANPDTLSPQSSKGGSPLPHPGPSKGYLLTPGWLTSPMSPGSPAKRPSPSPSPESGEILEPSPEGLSPSTKVLSENPDTLSPQIPQGPSKGYLLTPGWLTSPMSPSAKRPTPSPSLESGEILKSSSEDLSPSTQVLSANPESSTPPGPSKGRLPTPTPDWPMSPMSPGPTVSPPPRRPEPPPDEFMDMLLKGRIKRRSSRSRTVNSAQRDPRSTNIPN